MNNLEAALQVTNTFFLLRVVLHDVFNHGIWNCDISFTKTNLRTNLGDEILLRNLRFVLLVVSSRVDAVHPIEQDRVDLAFIIVTEDEETLAQVKVDFCKVTVVEL